MLKFFKCKHCGNIAIKAVDSGVGLVCCGEPMEELIANTEDAATEKHLPVVTKSEGAIHVEVGEVEHPMTEEHHISFIAIEKPCGYYMQPLDPGKPAHATFSCKNPDKVKNVYEYCNLHGLWKTTL